jgi:hypothetical protein
MTSEDVRALVIAELRWLADARDEYTGDEEIKRDTRTARHLADILERKHPVADGGEGWGWLPSWKWAEWDAMGVAASSPPTITAAEREVIEAATEYVQNSGPFRAGDGHMSYAAGDDRRLRTAVAALHPGGETNGN